MYDRAEMIRRLDFMGTKKKRSLKDLSLLIENEVLFVGVKPYSHNIISLVLMEVAANYGKKSANKLIRDFDLTSLGWKEVKE